MNAVHRWDNSYGYQSPIGGILDFVNRGCLRLLKAGGGPLSREAPAGKQRGPRKVLDVSRLLELRSTGLTASQIAATMHTPASTVSNYLSKHGMSRMQISAG